MKIALVTQLYAGEFEGGCERVVRAQARLLRAAGHEVSVLCGSARSHAGRDLEHESVDGTPVTRLLRLPGESYDLACDWPRLRGLVLFETYSCDAVWLHHWATLGGGLVRALARELPVTLWLHDAFTTCPRYFRSPPRADLACPEGSQLAPCLECLQPDAGGLAPRALAAGLARRQAGYREELLAAERVLAPSASLAARVRSALDLPEGCIDVLPHGDWMAPAAAPALRRASWDGARPLRLLHCGHLSRAKGILDLVRTLTSLPRGSVELDLAGGLLEDDLARGVAELAGDLPVRLHGPYDPARLAELAAGADLALFPSRLEESYGLTLDEVCDLGLPAWVSDRGALAERLAARGAPGRVLPAANPAAWAEALRALLADPAQLELERARLSARSPRAASLTELVGPGAGSRQARA